MVYVGMDVHRKRTQIPLLPTGKTSVRNLGTLTRGILVPLSAESW
jgi:hypothetical protein